jgi:hypothetical protein
MTSQQRVRKISALGRLQAQLKSKTKPEKVDGKTTMKKIPLTDSDEKRISAEIKKLEKAKT